MSKYLHYNFFENPQYYRELILNNNIKLLEQKKITGKSLACIFLTKFCSVGCSFCFFKSPPARTSVDISDQFNDEGTNKFIEFTKNANLGYILVSGGGEPMNKKKDVIKIIEHAQADRIVLVTSGSWAKTYNTALQYIKDIESALLKRKQITKVVLRISISKFHSIKLGLEPAINVVKIFEENFHYSSHFILQLKAFDEDEILQEFLDKIGGSVCSNKPVIYESDNNILEKKIPKRIEVALSSGYRFFIGISKVFDSSICQNLNDITRTNKAINIFEEDLEYAEHQNSTIVYNKDSSEGLDWSISYNGNICTWQNQSQDHYKNLYKENYNEIVSSYYSDPLTYSLIDKGNQYRYEIIQEVDEKAVLRSKAIGMRDAIGLILFEDEKTRLYYTVRVMQDYILDGKLSLQSLPQNIRQIVSMEKRYLIKLYTTSTNNIIDQQKRKNFNENDWLDFLFLIKMGHYNILKQEVQDLIGYFNVRSINKISAIEEVCFPTGNYTERFLKRLL